MATLSGALRTNLIPLTHAHSLSPLYRHPKPISRFETTNSRVVKEMSLTLDSGPNDLLPLAQWQWRLLVASAITTIQRHYRRINSKLREHSRVDLLYCILGEVIGIQPVNVH